MFVSRDNKPPLARGRAELNATPPPQFALFSLDRSGETPSASIASNFGNGSERVDGNATIATTEASAVSRLFFSDDNIEALQQGIRYRVWIETDRKKIISKQSETELLIVMRSIYLQYSRNEPYEIVQQVRELNAMVLDYCVRTIVAEIGINMKYRQDISTLPVPLERGQLATSKGSRQLEMFKF